MGTAPSFKNWGQVGLERAVTGELRSGGGKGMPWLSDILAIFFRGEMDGKSFKI
jgi:hypothetical protein